MTMCDNSEQEMGRDIVIAAIKAPFEAILSNAGENGTTVWSTIQNTSHINNIGYDVRNEEVVDMIATGIIDPTGVTRTALEKAASVAGTMLTTECVVTTIKDDSDSCPAPMGGGFGMM